MVIFVQNLLTKFFHFFIFCWKKIVTKCCGGKVKINAHRTSSQRAESNPTCTYAPNLSVLSMTSISTSVATKIFSFLITFPPPSRLSSLHFLILFMSLHPMHSSPSLLPFLIRHPSPLSHHILLLLHIPLCSLPFSSSTFISSPSFPLPRFGTKLTPLQSLTCRFK